MTGPGGYANDPLERRAVETARRRIAILGGGFLLGFLLVAGRLVDLTVLTVEEGARGYVAERQTERREIADRNGNPLVVNKKMWVAGIDGRKVWEPRDVAERLATAIPGLDTERLARRIATGGHFIPVARGVTPAMKTAIMETGAEGVYFKPETRRLYIEREVASHVTGFVGDENKGLAGLELGLEPVLSAGGETPLRLSIDIDMQHALREELAAAMATFRAIGAAGVIMDARDGEILALSSLPEFDPQRPETALDEDVANKVTHRVFELGSTFKMFTMASALEAGTASLDTLYDVTDPIRFGRFRISDYHPIEGEIPFEDVFVESSNIGTVQILDEIGHARHRAFLETLGLFERPDLELPGAAKPLLPLKWGPVESATVSYGHGISVTPLHLAVAGAAMVNGGTLVTPTLLKRDGPAPAGRRVISEATSAKLRYLLRRVVRDGTASKAATAWVPVGGKTGTADKPEDGRYSTRARVSTFFAAVPALNPRIVMVVTLDEPQPTAETYGFATAGWVAAPVIRKTLDRLAPVLRPRLGDRYKDLPPGVWPRAAPERESLRAETRALPMPGEAGKPFRD